MANTAEAIGALTSTIGAMNDRLDRDREDRKEADKETLANRVVVARALLELGHGHADIDARLSRVEPVAAMVTSAKAKLAGATLVLGFIGSLAIGGVWFFKDTITRWFTGA